MMMIPISMLHNNLHLIIIYFFVATICFCSLDVYAESTASTCSPQYSCYHVCMYVCMNDVLKQLPHSSPLLLSTYRKMQNFYNYFANTLSKTPPPLSLC